MECADGFELKATATIGVSQCTVANPVSLLTGCTRNPFHAYSYIHAFSITSDQIGLKNISVLSTHK